MSFGYELISEIDRRHRRVKDLFRFSQCGSAYRFGANILDPVQLAGAVRAESTDNPLIEISLTLLSEIHNPNVASNAAV